MKDSVVFGPKYFTFFNILKILKNYNSIGKSYPNKYKGLSTGMRPLCAQAGLVVLW
jgi:hypothetical protein